MAARRLGSAMAMTCLASASLLAACGPAPEESPAGTVRPAPPQQADVRSEEERAESPAARAATPAGRGVEDPRAADDELPSSPGALADLLLGDTLAADEVDGVREALAAHGVAALPEFIRLLASERRSEWACVRLQELGAAAEPAAPALVQCLAEDRAAGPAMQALVAIGPAGAAALLPLVGSEDPELRAAALDTIGRIGSVPLAGEASLLRAASDRDEVVRERAAFALRAVTSDRGRAIEVLLGMLRDDEEDVRHAALSTLRDPVDLLEPHIGTLVAHAERCREDLRDVMHVLSEIGPTATLVALRSPVEEVRELAADWAEAEDPVVRARLVELLADEAPEVAAEAFTALSRLDEPPPEVVQRAAAVLAAPWPAEASGDMGAWMRESNRRTAAVRIAEEQIRQGAASVRALLPSLADQSDRVRGTAACAIVRSAPAAELSRVLDAVRPLWHDDGLALDVRFSIALEVGARQGAGTEVVPWLASYAERGDVRRVEALEALGRIADPRAATVLLGQLDVVIWDVRVSAVAALGGHVGSDSRVAAALIEQLQAAPRAEVRAAAATALKRVRERTDVRAALLAARSDPADSVRNAVAAALRD